MIWALEAGSSVLVGCLETHSAPSHLGMGLLGTLGD